MPLWSLSVAKLVFLYPHYSDKATGVAEDLFYLLLECHLPHGGADLINGHSSVWTSVYPPSNVSLNVNMKGYGSER